MVFIATLAAFNYYPLLEYLLVRMWKPLALYADAMALLVTFLVVFLLLQWAAINWLEENVNLNPIVNAVGGALFGGIAAMLFGGILVISWFMLPGSAYYISGEEQQEPTVVFGVDRQVLGVVRFMSNDRLNGSTLFDPQHTFMEAKTYKAIKGATVLEGRRPTITRPQTDEDVGDEGPRGNPVDSITRRNLDTNNP